MKIKQIAKTKCGNTHIYTIYTYMYIVQVTYMKWNNQRLKIRLLYRSLSRATICLPQCKCNALKEQSPKHSTLRHRVSIYMWCYLFRTWKTIMFCCIITQVKYVKRIVNQMCPYVSLKGWLYYDDDRVNIRNKK